MTDIEWEAMGLWKWVAFLDRTKFSGNAKLWIKSKFSISALPLLANEKLQKLFSSKFLIRIPQLGANAKNLDLPLNT